MITATVFILVTLSSLALAYFGFGKSKKHLLPLGTWQLVVGCIAYMDVYKSHPLLLPLSILLSTFFLVYLIVKTKTNEANTALLIALHALRLPVELVLHALYKDGQIPIYMTFGGWNLDIFMGITALLLLILHLYYNKRLFLSNWFLIWNIAGLVLLSIIVVLAVLCAPLPIQQLAFDQPNVAVLAFPYVFLPSCVVPLVIASHVVLIRKTIAGDF